MVNKIYSYAIEIPQRLNRILLASIILSTVSTAAAEPKVSKRLVYVHPSPPILTELDNNGAVYDPVMRKMEVIFEKAGIEWQDSPVPIHRMYEYLNTKPETFSILVKTPYIIECCITSEKPVYRIELGVFRHAETPPLLQIHSIISKHIITIEGYSYGVLRPFLTDEDSNIVQYPANSHQSAYSMLKAGRADYLLDYRGPVREARKEKEDHDIQYDALDTLELYFIFNKEYPDAENIMIKLEEIASTPGLVF